MDTTKKEKVNVELTVENLKEKFAKEGIKANIYVVGDSIVAFRRPTRQEFSFLSKQMLNNKDVVRFTETLFSTLCIHGEEHLKDDEVFFALNEKSTELFTGLSAELKN